MNGFVMLPWTGSFARAEWKPLRREIPEAPEIGLSDEIAPLAGIFPKKRFFDYVFAALLGDYGLIYENETNMVFVRNA